MIFFCILLLTALNGVLGKQNDTDRLELILDALTKILQYMYDRVSDINLDAVGVVGFIEGQLQAYLNFEPDVFRNYRHRVESLRDKAELISKEGEKNVKINEKSYYATVGRLLKPVKRLLWYSSRDTDPVYIDSPIPCSHSVFNESASDQCLMQILGSGDDTEDVCKVTKKCQKMFTAPKKRGYYITHQALFWQVLEMRNCTSNISPKLMIYLCSNVMRDAEEIANAQFPLDQRDLFMEQIGICGMWGFKDFYNPVWLDKILQWQLPSGCFPGRLFWQCKDHLVPDTTNRVKREDKILKDGCSSHTTAVALLALTASLRFEAERVYDQNTEMNN